MDAPRNVDELDQVMQETEKPRRRLPVALMAMALLAGAGAPDPFAGVPRRKSFTEREGIDRQWDASEKAQAKKIADAKEKRARKAAKRRK